MASRKELEVGIRLFGIDDASGTINKAMSSMNGAVGGLIQTGLGVGTLAMIKDASNAYADQEFSFANLRIMEMNKLGKVNEDVYGKEVNYIKGLSDTYAKSTSDYTKMAVILRQNRISGADMMGGIGETSAKLAKVFDNMAPDKAGLFFARLKNDMAVPIDQMDKLADMAFRVKNLGVGENAEDALHQMTMFYARASLGARVLGLHGAKDAEDLGKLGAVFMVKGFKGQIVGTSFSKIFDGLRDTERQGKVKKVAGLYGIDMQFFNKSGVFLGIENFNKQLAKTANLSTQARAAIFKSFSTKQGLTTEEVEYLGKFAGEVKEIGAQYDNMAHLNDAAKEIIKTLQIQNDKTENAKLNMKAAFGKATLQDVQLLNKFLQGTYKGLEDLATEHPKLAGVMQEFGAGAATLTVLIGGLKTLGALNPTFTAIAAGLTRAFGPLLLAAAALEVLNLSGQWAEDKKNKALASGQPMGMHDRNTDFFDKMIEQDRGKSMFDSSNMINSWRLKKMLHGLVGGVGGEGFYDATMKNYAPNADELKQQEYDRKHFLGMSSIGDAQGWNKAVAAPSTQLTYSPQFVMDAAGQNMSAKELDAILKQHSQVLMDTINRVSERNRRTTYGTSNRP